MAKQLYLIRGLPGSGKSTFAKTLAVGLGCEHFEHDAYLYNSDGEYVWTIGRLGYAVRKCLMDAASAMERGEDVVVSNVFPTTKSLKGYRKLAQKYGYQVTYLVVENRHGNESIHDVPQETMNAMKESFSVKL